MQFKEADSFSSSYYHIHNPVVQRLGTSDAAQVSVAPLVVLALLIDLVLFSLSADYIFFSQMLKRWPSCKWSKTTKLNK